MSQKNVILVGNSRITLRDKLPSLYVDELVSKSVPGFAINNGPDCLEQNIDR